MQRSSISCVRVSSQFQEKPFTKPAGSSSGDEGKGSDRGPSVGWATWGQGTCRTEHKAVVGQLCADPTKPPSCGLGNLGTEGRRMNARAVVGQQARISQRCRSKAENRPISESE